MDEFIDLPSLTEFSRRSHTRNNVECRLIFVDPLEQCVSQSAADATLNFRLESISVEDDEENNIFGPTAEVTVTCHCREVGVV